MKSPAAIFACCLGILLTTAAIPASVAAHAEASAAAQSSQSSQTDSPLAPIARCSPAQPKWGQTLEIVYDPAAPEAAFTAGDKVLALFTIFPGDKQGWIRLEPRDDLLRGTIPIERGVGYISLYFITPERWDRRADLGIMVSRTDGKPARGANHQEMLSTFSPDTYLSFFEKERSLYPDNYAIYRDKWFIESNLRKNEFEGIIKKELPILDQAAARKESAELLFALSYGNLLLGREVTGRELLVRLTEAYPMDFYTTYAFSDYDYQAFSRQWKGEGADAVRRLALGLIAQIPEEKNGRRLFERHVMDKELSFETVSAVCRAWIRDEPENPNPYYYFALAAQSKRRSLQEAEAMISRALELLLKGNLRLHGDIGGQMTSIRMPAFYSLRAELRRDLGEFSDALADIKAAQAVTKETRPERIVIEGSIWSKLGFVNKAQACLVEAYRMGSKEAEAGLREIYERKHGSGTGFAEYLAGVLDKPQAEAGTAASSASPSGGKRPAPDFAVNTLDGGELKLSGLKGKVVVLNFWFVGCAPCRVEMPGLNKLVAEFADSDVVFVGLATDPADRLREFLAKTEFKYRIVPEASNIASLFGVSVFPAHIIIGKDGQIVYFLSGGSPDRHEQLRPLINDLLR